MTYIVRDCTVNPPRILVEIIEHDELPFDPAPQITMPRSHRDIQPYCLVYAAILSALFLVGILGYALG